MKTLLRGFGWDVFNHPPYSPDLAPSDFHLFLHLKSFLVCKHFNNDEELKENVSNWLKTQAATFYEEGIEKLVPRYDTCLQNFGSYVERKTVWCALWAGGIIGPYFFKNDEGDNVTVNGDRYRAMITNFFIPELNNHDVQKLWFQQDGATCHTARATIDLLKDMFGDRLISRFGPVNWRPRSCDLTP
ncbi:histone-lysine N-methyltransferase SETMAR [Trichonephila clavipes]|nr:histone-lysine N-methyltransferase SETMAR [Trichonephila clavipes]